MDNSLVDSDHFQFLFVNIYASNNKHLNTTLFPSVENKISQLQTTAEPKTYPWHEVIKKQSYHCLICPPASIDKFTF